MARATNNSESLGDYFAKLNLEGERKVWVENRGKIDYVYKKIEKYNLKRLSDEG